MYVAFQSPPKSYYTTILLIPLEWRGLPVVLEQEGGNLRVVVVRGRVQGRLAERLEAGLDFVGQQELHPLQVVAPDTNDMICNGR